MGKSRSLRTSAETGLLPSCKTIELSRRFHAKTLYSFPQKPYFHLLSLRIPRWLPSAERSRNTRRILQALAECVQHIAVSTLLATHASAKATNKTSSKNSSKNTYSRNTLSKNISSSEDDSISDSDTTINLQLLSLPVTARRIRLNRQFPAHPALPNKKSKVATTPLIASNTLSKKSKTKATPSSTSGNSNKQSKVAIILPIRSSTLSKKNEIAIILPIAFNNLSKKSKTKAVPSSTSGNSNI